MKRRRVAGRRMLEIEPCSPEEFIGTFRPGPFLELLDKGVHIAIEYDAALLGSCNKIGLGDIPKLL